MNKADLWLGNAAPFSGGGNVQAGNTEERGMDTARTIAQQPVWIVISRLDPVTNKTVQLNPQICRIDVVQSIRNASEKFDAMISISDQYVVLMGAKNNPYMPDLQIERSDQFFYANQMWIVVEFLPTIPGRLMASLQLKP